MGLVRTRTTGTLTQRLARTFSREEAQGMRSAAFSLINLGTTFMAECQLSTRRSDNMATGCASMEDSQRHSLLEAPKLGPRMFMLTTSLSTNDGQTRINLY